MRLLTLPFLLLSFSSISQRLSYNQYELLHIAELKNGPANIDNLYQDVKGDAFFQPQWLSAIAIAENGKTYKGIKVKFDQYKNKFYANIHDTIYDMSTSAISRYILYPSLIDTTVSYTFQKGFSGNGLQPATYIQVLASGKLTLVKYHTLEIKDSHEDGFLTTTKTFVPQDYYYLIRDNSQPVIVKLNKKTLEKEMADKWKEASGQAKEKEVSFNEEEGWKYLVSYYNTLP
jgi:hypothetical protein